MHDEDLVVGRKEILSLLRLSDWDAVRKRVKEGLPVEKVCGRIEMSRRKYQIWRDTNPSKKGLCLEKGEGSYDQESQSR